MTRLFTGFTQKQGFMQRVVGGEERATRETQRLDKKHSLEIEKTPSQRAEKPQEVERTLMFVGLARLNRKLRRAVRCTGRQQQNIQDRGWKTRWGEA